MTAREEVLAAVRAALAPTTSARPALTPDTDAPTAGVEIVEPPRSRGPHDLLALFAERVADYRAEVTRCASADLGQVVVAILDGAHEVVVPPGLGLEVREAVKALETMRLVTAQQGRAPGSARSRTGTCSTPPCCRRWCATTRTTPGR